MIYDPGLSVVGITWFGQVDVVVDDEDDRVSSDDHHE